MQIDKKAERILPLGLKVERAGWGEWNGLRSSDLMRAKDNEMWSERPAFNGFDGGCAEEKNRFMRN